MVPTVASHPPDNWESYRARLASPTFWRPLLELIGARDRVDLTGAQPARPTGTFPTFLSDSLVVKLYIQFLDGEADHEIERAVLAAVRRGPIPAAQRLSAGEVQLGGRAYWYLLTSRLDGEPLSAALPRLGAGERLEVARQLGEWVAALHATNAPEALREHRGPYRDFLLARRAGLAQRLAEWGSLPAGPPEPLVRQPGHPLAEAAPAFVDRWLLADPPVDEELLHGDLHSDHVLGEGSPWRPQGVIDFGDARTGCPLYELGPLVTSVFNGDRRLLDTFLARYGWPIPDRDVFARRALATALLHDFDLFAVGHDRHRAEWRERIADIRSLDELAVRLFGPSPARFPAEPEA